MSKLPYQGEVLALVVVAALAAACTAGGDASGSGTVCVPRTSTAGFGLPDAGSGSGSGVGDLDEVASFGDNPGALKMYVHGPSSGRASALVVALHGCTQTAKDYASAGWNELADRAGFAVVYPEQSSANNMNRCFNWFERGDTARGEGEARSIAAMVEHAKEALGATRAFVTGLSAGAAMTAVMLATYPDLFEAGAIMAGIPYGCASGVTDAFSCMSPGKDKTAEAWAALLPTASSSRPPRVSVWQGDADWTVRPANMKELVEQWSAVNGVSEEPSSSSTDGRATHAEHADPSGAVRVESWSIAGMGHGVALSPKEGCGRAGAYFLDVGVCSTQRVAEFFGLVDASGAPASPDPAGAPPGPAGSQPGLIADDCD